jgi:hypothetical protein
MTLLQKTQFFWFCKRWRFECKECNATLQQVGDKYQLTQVSDKGSIIWHKYGRKTLYSREWANIANGGSSDEEIIADLGKRSAAADRCTLPAPLLNRSRQSHSRSLRETRSELIEKEIAR